LGKKSKTKKTTMENALKRVQRFENRQALCGNILYGVALGGTVALTIVVLVSLAVLLQM